MSSPFLSAPGGSRGTTGPQGPQGTPGANGLSLDVFLYKFSSAVTGTPAAGFLRLDSATTPTRLVIATVDASGRDQTVLLQTALGGSGSKIRVQLRTNVGSWIEVTSTGAPVAVVGAIEWPVTSLVVGPAGAPLNTNEVFALGSSDTSALSAAITVLQQKTVALTTNGRFGTAALPETNNAVDLGSGPYRWKDMYMLGTLRCSGTGLAVDRIFNGGEQSGINLLPGGPDCKIQLSGTDYKGNADRAVTLATDGTLQKSGATISATGVVTGNYRGSEYLDTQGVNGLFLTLGPTAGIQFQNTIYKGLADRVCSHDADGTLKGTTATISAAGVGAFSQVKTGTVNAPTQSVGLTIADTTAGSIALTGGAYTGSANNILNIDATGLIAKTQATMSQAGALECKSIVTASITGNAAGPSADLDLQNQTGVGLTLVDGAAGAIKLTGTNYAGAAKVGQFLRIDDSKGTIVAAAAGAGDVVGPAGASDEAIARFDTATGKLLQSSSVSITDSGIMNGVTGINLATFALVQGPATTFEGSVFRGNNFLNPQATAQLLNPSNVGVAVKQDGGVRYTAAAYTGNSDRAVTLATDGTLQKTAATISASGTIDGENINATGNINGQNINALGDVSCVNLSAGALRANTWINSTNNASIDLAPTAGGAVGFRGTEYANSAGKLLAIVDTAGRLAPMNLVGPGTLRVDANGIVSVLLDPLAPAIVTPHNLTSGTSDPNFTVTTSSVWQGDEAGLGGWRCFDEASANGYHSSAQNTYSNGVQVTGAIAPMPTSGSWIAAVFSSDRTVTKLRYKAMGFNIPADFTVARFNGTTWIDTGFSVTNAIQNPGAYLEYTIPGANGGGPGYVWRGIAFIVSRLSSADPSNCLSLGELDFQ